MVTIRLEGSKELAAALKSMGPKLRAEVGKAVTATAIELRSDVVKRIKRGPNSGITYRKSNPKRVHTASAPGQAPADDMGGLANSIFFDNIGDMTAIVGSRLIYALYLEHGTRNMAARPYFRPAAEEMRAKFENRLEAAVRRATQ